MRANVVIKFVKGRILGGIYFQYFCFVGPNISIYLDWGKPK